VKETIFADRQPFCDDVEERVFYPVHAIEDIRENIHGHVSVTLIGGQHAPRVISTAARQVWRNRLKFGCFLVESKPACMGVIFTPGVHAMLSLFFQEGEGFE